MRCSKKSQAAMEFLMTYGWAILVVLIVIGALVVFGLLNPGKYLPAKCELVPGILCSTFTAGTDDKTGSLADDDIDNVTLLISNAGDTLYNFTIGATSCRNSDANATLEVFIPQKTEKFTFKCAGMVPGARFKTDLVFNYTKVVENEAIAHAGKGILVVDVAQQ